MLKPYVKKMLVAAGVLAAPCIVALSIYRFAVPVPYHDQWSMVPLLAKMHNHQLRIADLWAQLNEHRIMLPRIVMLALASVSGWNLYLEFAATYIFAVAILLLLYSMLRMTFQGRTPLWLIVVFSLVVFSPIQYDGWLWGFCGLSFFMTLFGTVLAIWSLEKWPGTLKGVLIAAAAAVFSSYSLSSGLFTWVVVGLMLLLRTPRKWGHIVIWVLAAAATIGLYLHNYTKPAHHPPLTLFMQHPLMFVEYVLIYLGSPLGAGIPLEALLAGVVILVTGVIVLILVLRHGRKELAAMLPWIALGAYAFIIACVTGMGRLGLGLAQAASSKYTAASSMLILAVMVLFARWVAICSGKVKHTPRKAAILSSLLLALFVYGYTASIVFANGKMKQKYKILNPCLNALKTFPDTPDEFLLKLGSNPSDPNVVRNHIRTLSELGIIVHSQTAGGKQETGR